MEKLGLIAYTIKMRMLTFVAILLGVLYEALGTSIIKIVNTDISSTITTTANIFVIGVQLIFILSLSTDVIKEKYIHEYHALGLGGTGGDSGGTPPPMI